MSVRDPCLVTRRVDPLCGFAEQPVGCVVKRGWQLFCHAWVFVAGVLTYSLCSFFRFPSGGRRENKHHTRRRCMRCCLLRHHWTVVHTTHVVQGPTCCICLPVAGGRAGVQGSYLTAERQEPQILSLPSSRYTSGVCLLVRMPVLHALPSREVLPAHACPAPGRPSSTKLIPSVLSSPVFLVYHKPVSRARSWEK